MGFLTATYLSADQNWDTGTTTYWFRISGDESSDLNDRVFGIAESGKDVSVLFDDGHPFDCNDYDVSVIKRTCVVTDKIRRKASGI